MAIPKKGSRTIVVEDREYRWVIRKHQIRACESVGERMIHVAVESDVPNSQTLVINSNRCSSTLDCRGEPVTPSDVRVWIRMAISNGWAPTRPGKQYYLEV